MARYIDAEALTDYMLERYNDLCEKHGDYDHYTTGYGDAIDVIEVAPTADVVPKSEVELLEGELIVESTRRKNAVNAYHDAKTEVAREIFDEILKTIFSKIPNKVMLINQERGFSDGVIFGKREAFFDMVNNLAELKKKYTGVEP